MSFISRRKFLMSAASTLVLGSLAGCSGSRDAGGAAGGDSGDAQEGGDLLAQIQERGSMVFATEGTWSPWTFHDKSGELTGFDIEVARGIGAALGR